MTATILIIDDIEFNLDLIETKLLSEYYVVIKASSGKEGLKILESNSIDIILLDVMMPEMDGFTFCRLVKANKNTSYIPIIMITALNDDDNKLKGLDSGADDFISKPVNNLELKIRIKSLLKLKNILYELKIKNPTQFAKVYGNLSLPEHLGRTSIVIIDDDPISQQFFYTNLSTSINKIFATDNIDTAIKYCQENEPEIILINCQILNNDPLRIFATLKNKKFSSEPFFVMIVEEYNQHVLDKAIDIGADDYIIYPIIPEELLARIKTLISRKIYHKLLSQDINDKIHLHYIDSLTQINNLRYFKDMIDKIISTEAQIYLAMIDIDNFKKVNDTHGHLAGDEVLKIVANTIKSNLRCDDLFARYGGEEFILVIYGIMFDEANQIINKLVQKVQNSNSQIPITISIGASSYKKGMKVSELINNSDVALYEAKNSGKNKAIFRKN